ncbi:hypothetical protein J3Q64DRAFT_1721679 [Phycomyces blakesleeanus]|uniref:HNH nuclease domain-containing protein n=1 Tax=Phycomyces blakesleeanus TaxID=4837 RepID=A0ABR3BCL0_PHYBL
MNQSRQHQYNYLFALIILFSKKAQWYMSRKLANPHSSHAKAIQLTFEAKGQGHSADDYMVEDRVNSCVSCDARDGLTVHHVVPDMYRRWMPLVIKSKSSRDLLLLCKICHDGYEGHALKLKKQLVKKYDIALEGKGWIQRPDYRAARKAAAALLRAPEKIPQSRIEELTTTVDSFAKGEGWTDLKWTDILSKCSELKDTFQGPDFVEHGECVVGQLMQNTNDRGRWPDLEEFVKQWRQHFLDHLKPKFLSSRWTVDGDIYTA